MQNTRYAISVLALKPGHSRHTCFIIEAISNEEAEGKGLAIARKIYPLEKGYYAHSVVTYNTNFESVTIENVVLSG